MIWARDFPISGSSSNPSAKGREGGGGGDEEEVEEEEEEDPARLTGRSTTSVCLTAGLFFRIVPVTVAGCDRPKVC
jgi:hypothetical protein